MAATNRSAFWLLAVAFCLACPGAPRAQSCLHYDEYAHWQAGLPVGARSMAFDDATQRAFVAGTTGWSVLDLADPRRPRVIFTMPGMFGYSALMGLHGEQLIVVDSGTLFVFDIATDGSLSFVGVTALPMAGTPRDMEIVADTAFIVSQDFGSEQGTLVAVDLSNGAQPAVLGSCSTGGWCLALAGNLAYVGNYYQGLFIVDISMPASPEVVGSFLTDDSPTDVLVEAGLAYVFGYYYLMQVLDVADPGAIHEVGRLSYPGPAAESRGVKLGNVVYKPGSRLLTIDVANANAPALISAIDIGAAANDLVLHDGWAFLGGNSFDVMAIPAAEAAPSLGTLESPGYCTSVSVQGALACATSSELGLCTVDLSTPQSPQLVAALDLGGSLWDVDLDEVHAYVADHEQRLVVVDLDDPSQLRVAASLTVPGNPSGIAVRDTLLYLTAGGGGTHVVSVADPEVPRLLGTAATSGFAMDIAIDGELACVADFYEGLVVLDLADPRAPVRLGSVPVPGNCWSLVYRPPFAFVAAGDSGLAVVDVSDPSRPELAATLRTPGLTQAADLAGQVLYLACGWAGVVMIDVASPTEPSIIGACDPAGEAYAVAVSPAAAVVACTQDLRTAWRHCDGVVAVHDAAEPSASGIDLTASPNPFNPRVAFGLELSQAGRVSLVLYDARGRQVRRLFDGTEPAGRRSIVWDGLDDVGRPAPSGVYFCLASWGGRSVLRKVALLR